MVEAIAVHLSVHVQIVSRGQGQLQVVVLVGAHVCWHVRVLGQVDAHLVAVRVGGGAVPPWGIGFGCNREGVSLEFSCKVTYKREMLLPGNFHKVKHSDVCTYVRNSTS